MTPHIRLIRRVARSSSRCHFCGWESVPYDAIYSPVIGGVALGSYCSQPHAERSKPALMEVTYG